MSKKYVLFAKIALFFIIFGFMNFLSIAVVSFWLECIFEGRRKCYNLYIELGDIIFYPVAYIRHLLNIGQDVYSLKSARIHSTVLFFNLIAYFLTRLIFKKIDNYQSPNNKV